MKVIYIGNNKEVEMMGKVCKKGEPVEFPDEVAKGLAQGFEWKLADVPAPAAPKVEVKT